MSDIELIRVVDFETTGLDPKDGARVCEIGWTDVYRMDDESWVIGKTYSSLVDPQCHIPSNMSAVHDITDEDIEFEKPPLFSEIAKRILDDASGVALCAHNSRFEQKFFTVPAPWIDTYRVALTLAPKAPGHKLGELRYWLKLDVNKARAQPAHRAGPDTYICAALLVRMLKKMSVQDMLEVSSRPAILTYFNFGKHAMEPIEDIETGYLHWVVDNRKDDEDIVATARHHLELRSPQKSMRV